MKRSYTYVTLILLSICTFAFGQQRIKDFAIIKGVENRQLIGYGLVVGLDGTGDGSRSLFTVQAVANMLMRLGVTVPAEEIRLRNVASVMVTAIVPAFATKGQQVDVTVSSMGDARSLEGGVLLMTPIMGTNSEVYAYAQGAVSIGGFNVQTHSGERIRKNYTLVGRVPEGAQLIQGTTSEIVKDNQIAIALKEPDFTTANQMVTAINRKYSGTVAEALNAGEVRINLPAQFQSNDKLIEFISELESLSIDVGGPSRIVINERTGTIVIGEQVKIRPVAVAHGNLNIEIRSLPIVSQPGPFSSGETVVVPRTQTQVTSDQGQLLVIENAANVRDVARALNALGVTPRDLIAIFQALKQAGALNAELVIM